MPEEPRNDDQPIEPAQQWSGEVEPPTQPYGSVSEPSFPVADPVVDTPAVFPVTDYTTPVEPDSSVFDSQQPSATPESTPVSPWGEPIIAAQPDVEPAGLQPIQPVTPVDPVVPIFSSAGPTAVATSSKKSKKPLIIGIVLAAVFVIFGGGSVLAYNVWYQNPEKVVTDALIGAATAKSSTYVGTIKVDGDGTKSAIDLTIKQSGATGSMDAKVSVNLDGKDYTVNGSAVIDTTGDLYFKVEKLQSIVDEYKKQMGAMVDASQLAMIDKLIAKIDGTWIKISSTDLKEVSDTTAAAKTCVNDTVAKFKDDKAAIGEVTDLYKKNQFIVIDKQLGEKDGSFGYVIKGDSVATKAFAEGLKDTKIYKALHDCDDTFTIDTTDFDTKDTTSADDGTVELWVSRWSHQITKMTANSTSDGSSFSAVITPTFNQPVEIKTPETSTTIKQLQADIQALIESAYTTEAYSPY